MKVKEIKLELRSIVEEFLAFPAYQHIFKEFAKIIGYTGDDMNEAKNHLFLPNTDGEIGFSISGMNELFLEFQLLRQLISKEPYQTLLRHYPEAIENIRIVATKMINGEDIGEEDLVLIFNVDVYDERRQRIDSEKINSKEQIQTRTN